MTEPQIIQLMTLRPDKADCKFANPTPYRVYSAQGICPAVCSTGGGSHEPKILEMMKKCIIQRGHGYFPGGLFYEVAPVLTCGSFYYNNGAAEPSILGYTRDSDGKVTDRHANDVANTIHTASGGGGNTDQFVFYPEKEYSQAELKELILSGKARVRELTARECFRLQGVDDEDIDKIYSTGLSNRQMIALAGNSITVDVFFHILRKLYIDTGNEDIPTLFDNIE